MSSERSKRFPDSLAGLSDLFFNYEHPTFDKLNEHDVKEPFESGADEISADEAWDGARHQALVTDAADFLTTLMIAIPEERIVGYGEVFTYPTAEEFANDMLARI